MRDAIDRDVILARFIALIEFRDTVVALGVEYHNSLRIESDANSIPTNGMRNTQTLVDML